jgi:hypothetical protein
MCRQASSLDCVELGLVRQKMNSTSFLNVYFFFY